jgi:2-dehydro-3-deoxyphosphooctonate aldolase (KDO 8-P synthase)
MTKQHQISLANFKIGNDLPFVLLAGPCQIESRDHTFDMAGAIAEAAASFGIPLVYKSSFDKANRSSIKTMRGVGMEKGLQIFSDLKKEMKNIPIVTDIHSPEQCAEVASVVDILQIPAFLCRQTDLVVAAAKTGRIINVKKGQFLAPWDMKNVAEKVTESGNPNVMLCERGTTFGYNTLVNDMRGLPIMAAMGHPVVYDATHSVQSPGGNGATTGGDRTMVPPLARAALATGACAAVFMETHQDPDKAPSDGPNMLKLQDLKNVLEQLVAIDRAVKPQAYAKQAKAA